MPTPPKSELRISEQTLDEGVSRERSTPRWSRELSTAIRSPDELLRRLGLSETLRIPAERAAGQFPLFVPESYLARMTPGNPTDPLLKQVLPVDDELENPHGWPRDAVGDGAALLRPGLLHKYQGRALLIATGTCAVNCRYCFRRHFPYEEQPRTLASWGPALAAITADTTIEEAILSGGDPLMLSDRRLKELCDLLTGIPHLRRLRIHSRLPIVLPSRVTDQLTDILTTMRLTPFIVVHANHPREIVGDCADALSKLVRSGITVLNQSVLLRGINDSAETLVELSQRLIDRGVVPYYLHQLDRIAGVAHFEVDEATGRGLIAEMRRQLPGYAVPEYVREVPGQPSKTPLT